MKNDSFLIVKRVLTLFFPLFILLSGEVRAQPKEMNKAGSEKPFTIGLVPERNIFRQIDRYTPLADYLSGKIGMKVKLRAGTRYGNIVNALASSEVEGSFLGSFAYVLAHLRIGVNVIARPESTNGSSFYHGLLFLRKDSGIKNAADMKGKRFVFVDRSSFAGYLFPLVYFHQNRITDYRNYFTEAYFTGTHEDTIYDVLNGKADIGAAKNTVFHALAKGDPNIDQQLKILTRSADVPENALVVRNTLDPTIVKALSQALLNMHDDPVGQVVLKGFGARRFVVTTDEEYEPVYQAARKIGLNLADYNYLKD